MINDNVLEGIIVKSWKYADDLLFRGGKHKGVKMGVLDEHIAYFSCENRR